MGTSVSQSSPPLPQVASLQWELLLPYLLYEGTWGVGRPSRPSEDRFTAPVLTREGQAWFLLWSGFWQGAFSGSLARGPAGLGKAGGLFLPGSFSVRPNCSILFFILFFILVHSPGCLSLVISLPSTFQAGATVLNRTQGFMHARQALYLLSHIPTLFKQTNRKP